MPRYSRADRNAAHRVGSRQTISGFHSGRLLAAEPIRYIHRPPLARGLGDQLLVATARRFHAMHASSSRLMRRSRRNRWLRQAAIASRTAPSLGRTSAAAGLGMALSAARISGLASVMP